MTEQDKEYLLRREAAQLRLAHSAADPGIRQIHQTMAEAYRRQVDGARLHS